MNGQWKSLIVFLTSEDSYIEKIASIKQTLNKLEEKQHNKEDNLKSSIEEIESIQREVESLKVVV